jgi:DUF4097 and DUF4098 domain-containing protein YvlB
MKRTNWITGFALALVTCQVLAEGDSVDESKAVSADGIVQVNVTRGEVDIRTWDEDSVRVVGTLDDKTEEFVFTVHNGHTRIAVKIRERESSWLNDDGSDLTIYMPESSQLEFAGVSTDVDVRDVAGEIEIGLVSGDVFLQTPSRRVEIQTVSGDIEMQGGDGRMRIKTVSGDVEAYEVTGDVQYTTVSGDIAIRDGGKDLRLESVSGDIDVRHDAMVELAGHSVSGDIDISGELQRSGRVEFDSMSGTIRLLLGEDLNASFDIETGSGSIRNRITEDQPKISRHIGDETLRFSVGDGSGNVALTTQSGDISLGLR